MSNIPLRVGIGRDEEIAPMIELSVLRGLVKLITFANPLFQNPLLAVFPQIWTLEGKPPDETSLLP